MQIGWVRRMGGIAGAMALALASTLNIAATPAPQSERVIVVLRDGTDSRAVARDHAARFQAQGPFVYEHALKGYAAQLSPAVIGALAADGRVASVEHDGEAHVVTTQNAPAPPWGLDRIDQRALPLSGSYTYTNTGAGVTAYIIDTGIRFTHSE